MTNPYEEKARYLLDDCRAESLDYEEMIPLITAALQATAEAENKRCERILWVLEDAARFEGDDDEANTLRDAQDAIRSRGKDHG